MESLLAPGGYDPVKFPINSIVKTNMTQRHQNVDAAAGQHAGKRSWRCRARPLFDPG